MLGLLLALLALLLLGLVLGLVLVSKCAKSQSAAAPSSYHAKAPEPKNAGHWAGYYIEVTFKSDTGHLAPLIETTPGYVWPNTLPFDDCTREGCRGHLL